MKVDRIIKGGICYIIYFIVIFLVIRYLKDNTDSFINAFSAPVYFFILVFFCNHISLMLTAIMDKVCAEIFSVKMTYIEALELVYVSSALNLILPFQTGSMLKAIYMKRKLTLKYSEYVSIMSGTAVINILVSVAQIILCLLVIGLKMSFDFSLIILFLVIMLVIVLVMVFSIKNQHVINKVIPFKKYSIPIINGFFTLLRDKRAVLYITFNYIFTAILGWIKFVLIIHSLQGNINFVDIGLYYGLYNASGIIQIIPGNVGISEAFVGMINSIMGRDFNLGVATVMVYRIYYFVFTLFGAIIFGYPIWKRYNKLKA